MKREFKTKPRPVGRPSEIGGKRMSVYLAPEHVATAKRLGNGNIAAGVRAALENAK